MLWDFDFVPQKETALFCGIRMMYHAKNIVEGVSGFTDAVALLNGGEMLFYGTSNTSTIESLVVNFEQYVDKFIYTSVSNVSKEFKEIDMNVEESFKQFPGILKGYRDKYKAMLDNPIL